ncbi:MAG: hypothetical protein EXR99_04655 [Gemmataceae bacterium]|nr:hypothetical protein [Gemmataceae bacterium]
MSQFTQIGPGNHRNCHECHTVNPVGNERCLACGIILWIAEDRWTEESEFAAEFRGQWFKEQAEDQFISACKSLIPVVGVVFGLSALFGASKAVRRAYGLQKKDLGYRFAIIRRLAFFGFFLNVIGIAFLVFGSLNFFFN